MSQLSSTSLLVLLLILAPIATVQQQCPLCFGGAKATLNNTIGGAADGVTCGEFVTDVQLNNDECRELQLVGYRYCDCPDYPEEYFCPMCKDSYVDIPNKFKVIPGTDKTCDERLFVKANAVTTCADAMKPGYVCGCPDAVEPFCQVCGGSIEDDSLMAFPDEILTINGVGSKSCRKLANEALMGGLTVEQCSLVQAEAFVTCGCIGSENLTSVEDLTGSTINATEVTLVTDATMSPKANDNNKSAAKATTYYSTMFLAIVGVVASSSCWLL